MLFANDDAVSAHSPSHLKSLMDRFANARTAFGLTISLKKNTKVLAQTTISPNITVNNYELEMVDKFTYLGSTINSKLSLDRELDGRIGMAAFCPPWNTCLEKPLLYIKTYTR